MKVLLLVLVFFSPASHAAEPLEGIYSLVGTNPGDPSKGYSGKVSIQKLGDAYRLGWFIGTSQTQRGEAYLEGDVLSVGYIDNSGQDFGVVSYKLISEKRLEGKWCPMGSDKCGTETLEFEKRMPASRNLSPDSI